MQIYDKGDGVLRGFSQNRRFSARNFVSLDENNCKTKFFSTG